MELREKLIDFVASLDLKERMQFREILVKDEDRTTLLTLLVQIDSFVSGGTRGRPIPVLGGGRRSQGKGIEEFDLTRASVLESGVLSDLLLDRDVFPTAKDVVAAVMQDFGIDVSVLIEQRVGRDKVAARTAKAIMELPKAARRRGFELMERRVATDSRFDEYGALFDALTR